MLAVFSHTDCCEHDMGSAHPESPARLLAIKKSVEELARDKNIEQITAKAADKAVLHNNHSAAYVEEVFAAAPEGIGEMARLDADTAMNHMSLQASLLAVGATTAAVDWAMESKGNRAFCAIRPPGHHAEPEHAMGFCIFNNIAIAAKYAKAHYADCHKVAVIDFDVHHGNGTQSAFYDDSDLFFASTHQYPFYPGSGAPNENGKFGNIVNVPLAAGSGGEEFMQAYDTVIFPALKEFAPDLLMISAGFDAHERDPLAGLNLQSQDYRTITTKLAEIAHSYCGGRMVSVLEGGYDLQALYESGSHHLKALADV